jgi:hypothetical protein
MGRIRSAHRTLAVATVLAAAAFGPAAPSAEAQAPLRKIGELELSLAGLVARLDPAEPAVPKNTAAGVRVVVEAGGRELGAEEVRAFLGGEFFVEAELSGPGLPRTITIPDLAGGEPVPADPLVLPTPALSVGGDYELANVRIVSGGRVLRFACPPERNSSRHSDSVAAVTRSSRERRSRSSPRSSLSTAATFRFAEKRPRSGRASLASPLALRAPSEASEPFFVVMDTLLLDGACCPHQVSNETVGRGTPRCSRERRASAQQGSDWPVRSTDA